MTLFLIQWALTSVVLAVVLFLIADQAQRYLYETVVDRLPWRVFALTPLLSAALVRWPLPFQDLFFNISSALLQAILLFIACWLGLRFQWPHAAVAGILVVAVIAPVASSSVESLTARWAEPPAAPTTPLTRPAPTQPVPAPPAGKSPGAQ